MCKKMDSNGCVSISSYPPPVSSSAHIQGSSVSSALSVITDLDGSSMLKVVANGETVVSSSVEETIGKHDEDVKSMDSYVPLDELKRMLQRQLEYYFSRENLSRDTYLLTQMDSDQYVSISTIATFDQVKRLTRDMKLIVDVLKASPCVQVDETEEKVRPVNKRSVLILREIPKETPLNEVEDIFSAPQCPKFVSCEFAHNNSWYVTFESNEDALNAYLYLRDKTFHGQPIMARIKAKPVLQSFVSYKNGIRPTLPGPSSSQSQLARPNAEGFSPSAAVQTQQNSPSPRVAFNQNVPSVSYPQNYPPFYPPPIVHHWSPSPTYFELNQIFTMNGLLPAPSFSKPHNSNSTRAPTYPQRYSRNKGVYSPRTAQYAPPLTASSSGTATPAPLTVVVNSSDPMPSSTPILKDPVTISLNAIDASMNNSANESNVCTAPPSSNTSYPNSARSNKADGAQHHHHHHNQQQYQPTMAAHSSAYPYSTSNYLNSRTYPEPESNADASAPSTSSTNNIQVNHYLPRRRSNPHNDHRPPYNERINRDGGGNEFSEYGQNRPGYKPKSRLFSNNSNVNRKKRDDNGGTVSSSVNHNHNSNTSNGGAVQGGHIHGYPREQQNLKQGHNGNVGASHFKDYIETRTLKHSVDVKPIDLGALSFPPLPGSQRAADTAQKVAQSPAENSETPPSSCLADVVKGKVKRDRQSVNISNNSEASFNSIPTDSSDAESCTNVSLSENDGSTVKQDRASSIKSDCGDHHCETVVCNATKGDANKQVCIVNTSTSQHNLNLNANAITPAKILTPPPSPTLTSSAASGCAPAVNASSTVTNQQSDNTVKVVKGTNLSNNKEVSVCSSSSTQVECTTRSVTGCSANSNTRTSNGNCRTQTGEEDHSTSHRSSATSEPTNTAEDSNEERERVLNGHHDSNHQLQLHASQSEQAPSIASDECKSTKDDSECSSIGYTTVSDNSSNEASSLKKLSYCEVAKLSKTKLATNQDNNLASNCPTRREATESSHSSSLKNQVLNPHRPINKGASNKEKERHENVRERQERRFSERQITKKESRRDQRDKPNALNSKDPRPNSQQNSVFPQRTRDRLYTE